MWPLDISLAALTGLTLYLVTYKLSFDDPRLLYNATTYAIAVPLLALAMAVALRRVASKFVQKSAQLGLLFSVCLHLLLLILAVNVVIFSTFMPHVSKGEKPERSPVRKTVPEHLFRAPQEQRQTPDWSKPVDTQTASRVIPREQRQLPPVQRSEPKLEMPKPREIDPPRPMKKMLMKREEFTPAKPMPSDSPGKLARRDSPNNQARPIAKPIDVPELNPQATQQATDSPSERQVSNQQPKRSAARRAPPRPEMASVAPMPSDNPSDLSPRLSAAARDRSQAMPVIGDAGLTRRQRQRFGRDMNRPAGSAPAPPSISIARESVDATRQLSPVDTPMTRSSATVGAQIATGTTPSITTQNGDASAVGGAEYSRKDFAARAGAPNVQAGESRRSPGRSGRADRGRGFAPAGAPTAADAMAASSNGTAGTARSDSVSDRMGIMDIARDEDAAGQGGADLSNPVDAGSAGLALDIMADEGPIGLADMISQSPGVTASDELPEIAAFEMSQAQRPRRKVGGPATAVGTKIAAVESFNRRVLRTKGASAAAPAGMAGPATEEAIELGLTYLASTQKEDGSWSLQGHGDEVFLRSDTAATGLCLLAFQGAGYTHLEHQHADTVSRGLKFLMDNQRSNGNLYRSETPESDRNVALYSHGIAALAMSEAYGMTQDRELRGAAQDALKYIIATQHRQRGGWRYTPQVSSDTSVSGWMMMSLKSGELAGLKVPRSTYDGINTWLDLAQQNKDRPDRYRYNPYAPDTDRQRHGRYPTPTMTAVGMLMRMYSGWRRDNPAMISAADYLLESPPQLGTNLAPKRDGYYWYYATQVMFHMGGDHWKKWNSYLNPMLLQGQIKTGQQAGSWDPRGPVPDRWSPHAGRLYVTTMNLLNLEVYYRHLPIYEDTAE
ncbi:hypothetical protein [Stieleria marina]|uniref:Prenyltransferase and squalene oxidase repeat protein n=1 Tax=Stieleria marina TaxID=1930275 RepID=A0A517NPA4_9BACT|nr:hypothetical protein K239x_08920 [Planctomycetes bacterium K23_9]